MVRWWRGFALGAATLAATLPGSVAQAGDPVAADALFREALTLLDAGKWDEACPKFRASNDLDPSVSTLVNLSRCSERDGKLATAWGLLAEASRLNQGAAPSPRRSQLEELIKKQSDALAPRVPRARIVIEGPDAAATKVLRDGVVVPASALSQPLPVDPGEHVIAASAEGFDPIEQRFTIAEGQTTDVRVVLLKAKAAQPGPGPVPPSVTPPVTPPPSNDDDTSSPPIAGWVLVGVGAAGMVAGGVLVGLAGAKAGDIPDGCKQDPYVCPTDADTRAANEASDAGGAFQIGGIVALAAGAALVATGVVVMALHDGDAPTAAIVPVVGPGFGGAQGIVRW